jgi:hypothetical protein
MRIKPILHAIYNWDNVSIEMANIAMNQYDLDIMNYSETQVKIIGKKENLYAWEEHVNLLGGINLANELRLE